MKDFKPNQWDTYKTLRRLHSEYNVSPFFQIDVVPDIVNKNQNIIQVPILFPYFTLTYYYTIINFGTLFPVDATIIRAAEHKLL